jgi:hypothetical protein
MNLGELRARARREMKDTAKPYLISDEDIDAWLNEAEIEAARRAFLLVDSTSDAAVVDITAGELGGELHPSVIYVRRARLASTKRPLIPKVSRSMDEENPSWEEASPSTPLVFVPDWQTGYFRIFPPSLVADTALLTVVRNPLATMQGDEDSPEIREHYHPMLLDWVKFRAYSQPDADLFNARLAEKHESAFIKNFGQVAPIDEHWALEQYYDVGNN